VGPRGQGELIDPLMAAFNAIAPMATNPWSAEPSIFVIQQERRII
jgi:hypothetical protein